MRGCAQVATLNPRGNAFAFAHFSEFSFFSFIPYAFFYCFERLFIAFACIFTTNCFSNISRFINVTCYMSGCATKSINCAPVWKQRWFSLYFRCRYAALTFVWLQIFALVCGKVPLNRQIVFCDAHANVDPDFSSVSKNDSRKWLSALAAAEDFNLLIYSQVKLTFYFLLHSTPFHVSSLL